MNLSDMKFSRMVITSKLHKQNTGEELYPKENLRDLVGLYWNCAYLEGKEGRDTDINGDAGAILHAIDLEIDAMESAQARSIAEISALNSRVAELENLISTFVESYRSRYSKTGGGIRSSAPMRREIAELNSAAKALGEK